LAGERSSVVTFLAGRADLQRICHRFFILNQPAYWPQAHPDFPLSPALLEKLNLSFMRLLKGEPLPYITSTRAFFDLDFFVTPDVLIPRPETELLVETALNRLSSLNKPCVVADVGTGSGCIAVTLACHQPSCRLIATDISYRVCWSHAKTAADMRSWNGSAWCKPTCWQASRPTST
jgi:HemK-like putative methylase